MLGHDVCADHLVVYVETDEQMIELADTVHNDQRARKVFTETKREAYERFLQIFKDQPELVRSARPEALPASVTIVPTDNVDLRGWADQLRTLPAVEKVQPMITAEALASLAPRYGTAGLKPPCPSSGERN